MGNSKLLLFFLLTLGRTLIVDGSPMFTSTHIVCVAAICNIIIFLVKFMADYWYNISRRGRHEAILWILFCLIMSNQYFSQLVQMNERICFSGISASSDNLLRNTIHVPCKKRYSCPRTALVITRVPPGNSPLPDSSGTTLLYVWQIGVVRADCFKFPMK